MGDYEEAEKYHKRATNGRYITAWCNYGYFLMKQHRYKEGIKIFGRALKINPLSINALLGIGRLLVKENDFENAGYFLQKATKIDPKHDLAHSRYVIFQCLIKTNKITIFSFKIWLIFI